MLGTIHTPLRVLLLDGDQPRALAMVRSLGRRRVRVSVATPDPHAAALLSRYCADSMACPEPRRHPADFRRWLFTALRRQSYDALLFCSAPTAEILASQAHTIRHYTRCALPRPQIAHDLSRPPERQALLSRLHLDFLHAPEACRDPARCHDYAVLALARRGESVAVFVHRLRGGADTHDVPWDLRRAGESVDQDAVRQASRRLLQATGWDGAATLAFRHDPERDRLALLGAHPGWGEGLELAIACGVDLPWLQAQLAAGHPITGPTRYGVGLKFLHLFTPGRRTSLNERFRGLFLLCFPQVRSDFVLRDPLPHLPLLGRLVLWLRRRWVEVRRPAPRHPPKLAVLPGGHPAAPGQVSSTIPTRAGGASP